jgi:predicted nuclease of predicted toxin-antitoxin system
MRLLLDQNLSAAVAASLRAHGIDAVHTSEVAMSTESDDVILEWCRQERRVAISRDTDFHAILARTRQTSPSVIRIRIEPLSDTELTLLIKTIIAAKSEDLRQGVAITVKITSMRTHKLPLISPSEDDRV